MTNKTRSAIICLLVIILKFKQNKILILCWATYLSAYICRINMSTALLQLESAFEIGGGVLGVLGSLFFVTYAIGQLINGFVGDRVSPYVMLVIAMAGTVTLNLTIGISGNITVIMICWTANGYFQSMIWGPLMRVLSSAYTKERNANITMVMSTSMVLGYIFSWVVFASLFSDMKWNLLFLVPAAISISPLIIWGVLLRRRQNEQSSKKETPNLRNTIQIIKKAHLAAVIGVCVCSGLIRESISLWAPVMMIKTLGFEPKHLFILLFLIPIFNFSGILFARWLMSRAHTFKNPIGSMLLIFFTGILICGAGFLFLSSISGLSGLFFMSCISGLCFGANSILLSLIPLSYAKHNIVSTLVGVFDFCSYIGAAISAYGLGIILEGASWKFIPLIWICFACAAITLSLVYRFKTKRKVANKNEQEIAQQPANY